MNKKKIIFVGQSLKIGGVERALVEQVNNLAISEDVSLLLFSRTGVYNNDINAKVKIIYGNWLLNCIGRTKEDSKINIFIYIVRNSIAFLVKLFGRVFIYNFIFKFSRKYSGFDIAISYVNDQDLYSLYSGCNQFVVNNVNAKKKIAWIHSDPRRLELEAKHNTFYYKKMDYIISVSQTMKFELDKLHLFPSEKSLCIYNIINKERIINHSKEFSPFSKNKFSIVTVGRLEDLKGTKDLLSIAKCLKKINNDFIWYFLGDGVMRSYCESYIKENHLEYNVVLLGNKNNPYPYISNADILVSGSKTETFGIAIVEALLLKTPVIALEYCAISEIINKNNGFVCKTYDDIYEILKQCLYNQNKIEQLVGQPSLLVDYNKYNQLQFRKILDLI